LLRNRINFKHITKKYGDIVNVSPNGLNFVLLKERKELNKKKVEKDRAVRKRKKKFAKTQSMIMSDDTPMASKDDNDRSMEFGLSDNEDEGAESEDEHIYKAEASVFHLTETEFFLVKQIDLCTDLKTFSEQLAK